MSSDHSCLVKVDSEPWISCSVTLHQDELQIRSTESWTLLKSLKGGDVIGLVGGENTSSTKEQLTLVAFARQGDLRKLMRIHFEGSQVGELQDLLSKQDSFQVRRRKKLLVLVNPVGGRGKAVQIWKQVEDVLVEVGVVCEVVITTHAGHAREIVSSCKIGNYGGVVTVSGDGGLHEVLNGLSSRSDWKDIRQDLPIGMVPGGSGHAVHCSLLFHQGEAFSQEVQVATMNLARGRMMASDYIECQAGNSNFLSIFGVAWGVIPECDLGSEFLRKLGPMRGYFFAMLRIIVPRLHYGTVYYLPANEECDVEEVDLPCLDSPVPSTWQQLEGPFHNVYAMKQPWLDYSALFCPQAKPSEGRMWLVVIKGSMDRAGLLRWALNTENAAHLQADTSLCVPIKAFRFVPSSPGPDCPMTVDAERLIGTTVQGKIRKPGCNIMVK